MIQHIFRHKFYDRDDKDAVVSQRWGTELNQILSGHTAVVGAPKHRQVESLKAQK